jgi:signal transduction histidine kinase
VRRRIHRFWLLPGTALLLSVALGVTTRLEQERQVESLRSLYESHARFVGNLVGESAQQAAWSTDLVYSLSAESAWALLGLIGAPGEGEDCVAMEARIDGLAVWAARHSDGVQGCLDRVPPGERIAFVDAVLAAPEPDFVDDVRTRALGVYCTASAEGRAPAVLCLDRARLDGMRRTVGLGPLLSQMKDRDLDYVVIQDPGGILAASPRPGPLSDWAADPLLDEVLKGAREQVRGRLLERDGQPVYEVVGPLDLADGTRAVVRTGLDATALGQLRERIEHRQAVMAGVLLAAVLLAGALAWVLVVADRHRAQFRTTLRRREDEARHWQSLGQMAATVAHEVRNPLNTIGMALQRLSREVRVDASDAEEFRDLLALSVDASDRVERVVAEFLELGRPLVLDLRPYRVDDLLSESVAPLALRAEAESKRLVVGSRCPGEVVVDRRRFGQILSNLVSNALDAVATGGQVEVTVDREGDGFRLCVTDDGPGMDAGTLARAGEPFATTKAQGTGLGLPLARRLAEAHGGSLDLASSPGQGTRASVRLPGDGRGRVPGRGET